MRHNIARALRKLANRIDPIPRGPMVRFEHGFIGARAAEGLRLANAAIRSMR